MKPLIPSLLFAMPLLSSASAPLPAWAGRAPNGDVVRVAVPPPANSRFEHLAWPKAVRTADGPIVLGYLAGTHHGSESCPAVSVSSDGGKTFSGAAAGVMPRIGRSSAKHNQYGVGSALAQRLGQTTLVPGARQLRLEFPGAIYHVINAPEAHKSWQLPHVDLSQTNRARRVPVMSVRGMRAQPMAAARICHHGEST
ncbi:MAG: hypothetical protein HY736_25065 [Verrucomicrobia bacterium]|nr:hypothetical protein [Verrucomicrobiota bacterium]